MYKHTYMHVHSLDYAIKLPAFLPFRVPSNRTELVKCKRRLATIPFIPSKAFPKGCLLLLKDLDAPNPGFFTLCASTLLQQAIQISSR